MRPLASVKVVKLDRVLKTDRTIQPSYSGCTFQPGYLVFSCKDEATAACGSEMLEETWFPGSDSFLIPRSGLERKLVLKIILWSGSLLVWENMVGWGWGRGSAVQDLASQSPTVPKLQSFNLRFNLRLYAIVLNARKNLTKKLSGKIIYILLDDQAVTAKAL